MKKFKKISLKKGLLFLLLIVCIGILTIYFLIAPERFVIIKRHGASTTVTYINPEKEIPRETNLKGNEFNVYYYNASYWKINYGELKETSFNSFVTSYEEFTKLIRNLTKNKKQADVYNDKLREEYNEDFFKKHNLAVMCNCDTYKSIENIESIVADGERVTINCNAVNNIEPGYNSGNIIFISLNKEIKKVKFDIYETKENRFVYAGNVENVIVVGTVISIIAVIITIMYMLIHNQRVAYKEQKDGEGKNANKVKNAIALYIVGGVVVILALVFFTFKFMNRIVVMIADKPIIYLYPTEEQEINVQLLNDNNLTCTYPNYKKGGWSVIAKPNGDLKDLRSGRELYSLYYECKNEVDFKVEDNGFIVKGEDTAKFLEDKLSILGLNEKEAEEFIVYWLPKLQQNKFNYIRFATTDEINENMPIKFSEKPDSLIRILMTYKKIDKPITIKEQKLETPKREGFVAVEWGGVEILK